MKCAKCGKEFTPTNNRQIYCGSEINKTCPICGKPFKVKCGDPHAYKTCGSAACRNALAAKNRKIPREHRECPICHETFTPTNNTQVYCGKEYHELTCVICGRAFKQSTKSIKANKGVARSTCSKECRSKLHKLRNSQRDTEAWVNKLKKTGIERYGVDSAAKLKNVQREASSTYKNRTGYDHPSHNPKSRSKSALSLKRLSSLEKRIMSFLESYDIDFIHQYMVSKDNVSHVFDFYIPKYKILVDADGIYYHSYISDPDGKRVRDDYDDIRMYLVPEDHIFVLAIEGNEDKTMKRIHDIVKESDSCVFDYDSDLFKWCRSIDFPYPEYTEERMNKDWFGLCRYSNEKYIPQCKIGISIVKNFHRSIYDARVGNCESVKDAWYDDDKLKKVIENRLIYKNDVEPSKILAGFNISKIGPTVSLFNPILAKFLVKRFLSDFDTVFDPFSGFSGRLLGVSACGKSYIGQDINEDHVKESNEIIRFLSLDNASVSCKDVMQSEGEYECLMTCPPYGKKEIYGGESCFKTCDEWIDECLERFKCKRYVFVVDETSRYSKYVSIAISNSSHFNSNEEYVIVIDR